MKDVDESGAWPIMDGRVDDLPVEPVIPIDLDDLEDESSDLARRMIGDLNSLYGDEDILSKFPKTKARLDIEFDTLKSLIKMRKSGELCQENLLAGINQNPTSAALYASLGGMQRCSLQITGKINDTVDRINKIIKSFQTELDKTTGKMGTQPIPINEEEEDKSTGLRTYRGAKAFIKSMESQ